MTVQHPDSSALDRVQNRIELARYLSQSLIGDYVQVLDDEFSQRSTYVKSYLVEAHLPDSDQLIRNLRIVFDVVEQREDPQLLLLIGSDGSPYFADRRHGRYLVVHSLANAKQTDSTLEHLTERSVPGFDRSWMPTEFLMNLQRGVMTGFKFMYEKAVSGVSGGATDLFSETDMETPKRQSRSRITFSSDFPSRQDYDQLQDQPLFRDRKAVESLEFLVRSDDGFISNAVYSNGKIVGHGTSINSHLLTVDSILQRYRGLIDLIESYGIGWVGTPRGFTHTGEPLTIRFPEHGLRIQDLYSFAESVFRPSKPFRLLAVPSYSSEDRIDLEVTDVHTGDPFAVELTKRWMRIYLPRGSCGNVVARLLTNLQHGMSSEIDIRAAGESLLAGELMDDANRD